MQTVYDNIKQKRIPEDMVPHVEEVMRCFWSNQAIPHDLAVQIKVYSTALEYTFHFNELFGATRAKYKV
jgi:hypothetical protein